MKILISNGPVRHQKFFLESDKLWNQGMVGVLYASPAETTIPKEPKALPSVLLPNHKRSRNLENDMNFTLSSLGRNANVG